MLFDFGNINGQKLDKTEVPFKSSVLAPTLWLVDWTVQCGYTHAEQVIKTCSVLTQCMQLLYSVCQSLSCSDSHSVTQRVERALLLNFQQGRENFDYFAHKRRFSHILERQEGYDFHNIPETKSEQLNWFCDVL